MASDGYYRRLGRDAWRWLTAQLPDRVFQPALEQALFAVPGLRSAENSAEPDFEPEAAPADEISRLSPEEYQDLRHGPLGHLLEDVEDDEVSEDIELPDSPTSYLTL